MNEANLLLSTSQGVELGNKCKRKLKSDFTFRAQLVVRRQSVYPIVIELEKKKESDQSNPTNKNRINKKTATNFQ
jgi:hypothetical protein